MQIIGQCVPCQKREMRDDVAAFVTNREGLQTVINEVRWNWGLDPPHVAAGIKCACDPVQWRAVMCDADFGFSRGSARQFAFPDARADLGVDDLLFGHREGHVLWLDFSARVAAQVQVAERDLIHRGAFDHQINPHPFGALFVQLTIGKVEFDHRFFAVVRQC